MWIQTNFLKRKHVHRGALAKLRPRGIHLLAIAFAAVQLGCVSANRTAGSSGYDQSAINYWQDEAIGLIKKYQLNPLRASRVLAYLHKGIHELHKEAGDQSFGPLTCMPVAIDSFASKANEYFFPLETPGKLAAKSELRRPVDLNCRNALAKAASVFAANRTLAEEDGAFPPRKLRSNPAAAAGNWKATPPVFVANPSEPYAGEWKTFLIAHPTQVLLPPPAEPGTSAYRAATMEVLDTERALSKLQRQLADSWNLDAGSATPPGVWNLKLRELLDQHKMADADVSRFLAVFNMAMYDAMVTCWHYKYTYWIERPITAAERLGLGVLSPHIVTPPFPGYPSGHATLSGAAAEVIAAYLPDSKDIVREWAREAALSRLWGGIHFRFDNDEGLALGRAVGRVAISKMPPRSPASANLLDATRPNR